MTSRLHNRTRRSASIPRTLLKRGRVLELPVYYVLRLSDLAREGLEHSGSHRFADHIYRNQPSGRGVIGKWLDARLLTLPAVRSFRSRYLAAREEIVRTVLARLRDGGREPIHVLSVPCGIPRELADAADDIRRQLGTLPGCIEFHGIDLDAGALAEACAFAQSRGLRPFCAHLGDALSPSSYPIGMSCITSTGLAEFLADDEVVQLYEACHRALAPDGLFVSSGMQSRRFSEYLLRLAEIDTHYRGPDDLLHLAERVPFRDVHVRADEVGLQSILTARA